MAQKTYFGVDLSAHNFDAGKTVKFEVLKKKVDFVILRLGWVGNGNYELDTHFGTSYALAKKAGIPVGVYVYMYSKSEAAAKKGAKWALKQLKGKTLDIPYIFCDMEDISIAGLSEKALTAITDAFCQTVEAGGYKGGVYASRYWFDEKLGKSLRKKYKTWIAHYTSDDINKYRGKYDMWQNSEKGKVSGVYNKNGTLAYVDTNYMYTKLFATKHTDTKTKAAYYPKYTGTSDSIVDALKYLHIDASMDHRKRIAKANNIKGYIGTASQNKKMLALLKAGKLIKE